MNPSAEERECHLKEIHQDLTLELINVQNQQKATTNHLWASAPKFQVGDMVLLLRHNITTTRPRANLDYPKLGPFYIHDVFHVSLLEVYHPSVILGHKPPWPPPIELECSDEYEVEEILDSKILSRKLYYLVC